MSRRAAVAPATIGRRIEIRGVVQGVGFRPWVYRLATEAGLGGAVRNDSRGVVIDAFGPPARLDAFTARLRCGQPPAASVEALSWRPIVPVDGGGAPSSAGGAPSSAGGAPSSAGGAPSSGGFRIVGSRAGGERRVSIPADLATCEACLGELFDPRDRRYRYPFINCTHCGPRFTIATGVPYDRPATTMAPFAMCPDCAREYADPGDRRFHAQPIACPRCGPQLRLLDPGGRDLAGDPIRGAARALAAGRIVAVKGIGGFHLACDATSRLAVARLRRRKRRQAKPFAVMVRDLEAGRRLALIGEEEAAVLAGVERPIVLVRLRPGSGLAPEVAPGLALAGLILPYSPLHHLLLRESGRPLLMTSGNLADEPIAYLDLEARERLGGLADLFLVHDRGITSRCDDSVVRVVAGGPTLLRRSRGYTPRSVPLRRPVGGPVLGCGAQLKNTFCLALGDSAYLGPHVGDLETLEAYDGYRQAVERMERFLGVEPMLIAHDLHPDYLSTRYARERGIESCVAVQHHHAHLASGLAEHRLAGPAVGVIYDGTGYGTDGTAWGGEVLLGDAARYERVASLRPLPLPGGELAIREVWRLALVLLDDAYDGEPPLERLALFRRLPAQRLRLVRQMVVEGVQTPHGRGLGRYFDALGALVLGRSEARYEGEVALAWAETADGRVRESYPFHIDRESEPWEIDLRPMVGPLVGELLAGVRPEAIAGRFHRTLIEASARVVRRLCRQQGRLPVVLSGGCFANPLLAEGLRSALEPDLPVHLHRQVPPGDGGIALGQVLVADALAAQRVAQKGARSCV